MDEKRFDRNVRLIRDNLESLLNAETAHIAIREAFLSLDALLKAQGMKIKVRYSSSNSIENWDRPLKDIGFTIPIPNIFGLAYRILSRLSKYSGSSLGACYHEVGEISYLLPSKRELFSDHPFSMSDLSPSDIYGDLLASTFLPISPEEQIRVLEEGLPLDSYPGLNDVDIQFINQQTLIFQSYEPKSQKQRMYPWEWYNPGESHNPWESHIKKTKKHCLTFLVEDASKITEPDPTLTSLELDPAFYRHHNYGPQLKAFYIDILKLQIGYNPEERIAFQLRMYDVVQQQIKEGLKGKKTIDIDTFSRIIFDPKKTLYALGKTP